MLETKLQNKRTKTNKIYYYKARLRFALDRRRGFSSRRIQFVNERNMMMHCGLSGRYRCYFLLQQIN